jgi:hypothetical protein
MKRIPHAREVDQSIRAVRATVKGALKGVNAAAAQLMAKGDYASAEALVATGREIQEFQSEVDSLRKRWRELRGTGGGGGDAKMLTSPLWAYYQPILKALVEAGSEARREELEPAVERIMGSTFQPGDRDVMARGQARWQRMIRRARKQLVAQGWLEEGSGAVWRITAAGRQAAKKSLEPVKAGTA